MILLFCNKETLLTPEGLWHRVGSGDTFPVFVPHRVVLAFRIWRCHRLSGNSVFKAFMLATDWCEDKSRQNKPDGL